MGQALIQSQPRSVAGLQPLADRDYCVSQLRPVVSGYLRMNQLNLPRFARLRVHLARSTP